MRERRGFTGMVIRRYQQHPTIFRRACRIGVLEHVPGPVHARPLAVPNAEYAVIFSAVK